MYAIRSYYVRVVRQYAVALELHGGSDQAVVHRPGLERAGGASHLRVTGEFAQTSGQPLEDGLFQRLAFQRRRVGRIERQLV